MGPRSLNLLKGDEHDRVKLLMNAAFSKDAIRTYLPAMQKTILQYLEDWCSIDAPFSGLDKCTVLAAALFGECLLGLSNDSQSAGSLQSLFDDLAEGFQTVPVNLPFTAYGKAIRARESITRMVTQSLLMLGEKSARVPDCSD